jgi:hypothetical protein
MSTTPRHNHLTISLTSCIFELFKKKEVYPLQEECALVFYGKRMSGEEELIDPKTIESIEEFKSYAVHELDFVQPDFLLFQHNEFIQDTHKLKTAGIPDLIVEVWSHSNKKIERDMKFRLYSSSNKCEHWYIEQNNNLVTCFRGKQQLKNQYLSRTLITTTGLEFDLTHLAL